MQTRFPDAYNKFKSLDDIYYYGGQNAHNVIAVLDHSQPKSSEQIQLKNGDLVGIAGKKLKFIKINIQFNFSII